MNEFDQNLSLTANELKKAIEALKIALQFDFLVARNKTSHTFDEDIAKEVYSSIVVALPFFEDLYIKLVETLK